MADRRVICVAQVGYGSGNIREHVGRIQEVISRNRDCDLIVFPELALHGHPSVDRPEGFLYRKMKVVYGQISSVLYRFVREVGARVIIGEIKRKGDELYNVATYVDPERTQHYTKTHVHWTENFAPGRSLRTFDAPLGKVGISICFDSAFPEVWRSLALMGARVLVNIAAVPAHFSHRYMHRRMEGAALDNQAFVIYANRPGPSFSGYSAVFDPRGEFVASLGAGDGVLRTEVDLDQVEAWREEEQVFPNRRPRLYRPVVRNVVG